MWHDKNLRAGRKPCHGTTLIIIAWGERGVKHKSAFSQKLRATSAPSDSRHFLCPTPSAKSNLFLNENQLGFKSKPTYFWMKFPLLFTWNQRSFRLKATCFSSQDKLVFAAKKCLAKPHKLHCFLRRQFARQTLFSISVLPYKKIIIFAKTNLFFITRNLTALFFCHIINCQDAKKIGILTNIT